MNENIELKIGDVVKLVKPVSASLTNADAAIFISVEVGQLFTVAGFNGDNLLVQTQIQVNQFNLDVALGLESSFLQPYTPVQEDGEVILPPEEPEEPEDDMTCDHLRYSSAVMEATTKRPEVFLYQGALKTLGKYAGNVDGWYGNGSAKAVSDFQTENGLGDDGKIGKDTATKLIGLAQGAGFVPDLKIRIMSVIAFYEVSNRADAFGMAENDIGDGAGANYGIFQCNSYGSVVNMLKLAGRNDLVVVYNSSDKSRVNPEIKDWFGSAEGIATQVKYFEEKLYSLALRELHDFGSFDAWENDPLAKGYWERAVLLFCDTVVQNGSMWSPNRKPFWKTLSPDEASDPHGYKWPELYHGTWWDETLGDFVKYADMKAIWWEEYEKHGGSDRDSLDKNATEAANKSTAQRLITIIDNSGHPSMPKINTAKLLVVAQIRSRSSWDKYWYQAVASRRITDATGSSKDHPSGVVNGREVDLVCDYQL